MASKLALAIMQEKKEAELEARFAELEARLAELEKKVGGDTPTKTTRKPKAQELEA